MDESKGGDSMKGLDGWTHMGNFGSCHIYAKGNERCLVDPKTGQSTFEYKVKTNDTGYDINIDTPVSDSVKNGGVKNVKL